MGNELPAVQVNFAMRPFRGFEGRALFGKPLFEFLATHEQ